MRFLRLPAVLGLALTLATGGCATAPPPAPAPQAPLAATPDATTGAIPGTARPTPGALIGEVGKIVDSALVLYQGLR